MTSKTAALLLALLTEDHRPAGDSASVVPGAHETSPQDRRRAMRAVASGARDADDARLLLDALGLLEPADAAAHREGGLVAAA